MASISTAGLKRRDFAPFVSPVGIAWFDELPPPMEEVALRIGGLPLMRRDTPWPECPLCAQPMLFRAQLPLAVSGLTRFDDERVVLVFECHSRSEGQSCSEGAVVVTGGPLEPIQPPTSRSYRVTVTDLGPRPDQVRDLMGRITQPPPGPEPVPCELLEDAPPSITEEAARVIEDAGGAVEVWPSPPTVIAPLGGRLVPFDDDVPGTFRTTLPPLQKLAVDSHQGRLLGLLGGTSPGGRDGAQLCGCGGPTRTVVRLVCVEGVLPANVSLGPATVQVCLRCDVGKLLRSHRVD
jgi:hypothetical protein